jgi:TRAP-type C4-dicarboxylate transport system substrate-binding protein
MNIQLEKLELIKMLLETNDESVINSIKTIFKSENKDWWEELSEEQRFEIEEAEKEIEKGEYVNFEEFIQKHIE